MTKRQLFKAAHAAARLHTAVETYRAAFARVLRALYGSLRQPEAAPAAPVALTTADKLERLASIVIMWPSSLRGTFAFRFVCSNADRLVRFGAATRFTDKQAMIVSDLFAKHAA